MDLERLYGGSFVDWERVAGSWAKRTVSSRLLLFAARRYLEEVPSASPDPERADTLDSRACQRRYGEPSPRLPAPEGPQAGAGASSWTPPWPPSSRWSLTARGRRSCTSCGPAWNRRPLKRVQGRSWVGGSLPGVTLSQAPICLTTPDICPFSTSACQHAAAFGLRFSARRLRLRQATCQHFSLLPFGSCPVTFCETAFGQKLRREPRRNEPCSPC